ncbi:hypothetical protein AB0L40_16095 [Patulibacter sp. NPDC049589]|uniref:hypothetical protein n=1 Tax=Patulibacter sp. NPDC049589 TaxID=3154731 RepID=UPI00342439CA
MRPGPRRPPVPRVALALAALLLIAVAVGAGALLRSATDSDDPAPAAAGVPATTTARQEPVTTTAEAAATTTTAADPAPDPRAAIRAERRRTRTLLRRAAAAAADAGGAGTGAAVGTLGPGSVARAGDLRSTHAWSTMKLGVLSAVLRARRDGELPGGSTPTAAERSSARSALTASDNDAALALFGELEDTFGGVDGASDRIEAALSAGTGRSIPVNRARRETFSTFGQTDLALTDGVRFVGGLAAGCVLSGADTTYVTGLMRQVVPAQRWGLGSPRWGAPVAFKGGWGPEAGGRYVAVQYGVLRHGRRGVVVAVAALVPGGLESATPVLSRMARALQRALPRERWPLRASGCPAS